MRYQRCLIQISNLSFFGYDALEGWKFIYGTGTDENLFDMIQRGRLEIFWKGNP
jgi:hypothetical protein